jgi:hypothetical protein
MEIFFAVVALQSIGQPGVQHVAVPPPPAVCFCNSLNMYKDRGILFQFDADQDVDVLSKSICDTVIPLGGSGKLFLPPLCFCNILLRQTFCSVVRRPPYRPPPRITIPLFCIKRLSCAGIDQVHISGPKPLYTTLYAPIARDACSTHAISFAACRYSNYTSNERFRREMQKHDRQKFGPRDKYFSALLTSSCSNFCNTLSGTPNPSLRTTTSVGHV